MTLLAAAARRRSRSFFTLGLGKSLDLSGVVNLVVDGNSIMANYYTSVGGFHGNLMLFEPLASAVDVSSNVAISGATWEDMADNVTDVNAAWVNGAENILYLGETRNQIVRDYRDNNITDQATLESRCRTQLQRYLTNIRTAHPEWRIIIGETLPSGGANIPQYQVENAAFVAIDAWLRDNVDTLDLHAVVGFRNHPAFDHDGLSPEPFQAYPTFWQESAPRWTHPRDPGKAIMAQNVNAAVAALAARG